MIISFRDAGLQASFETGSKAGIRPDHAARLRRILGVLDGASSIEQIRIPGYDLHKLGGNLAEFWSVKVNGNWRVIFRFDAGEVELVDYLDYH